MPRRSRPQPGTPPSLPPIPPGAYKKAYYPFPDTVYYLADGKSSRLVIQGENKTNGSRVLETDSEWSRGTISNDTKSTSLHIVSVTTRIQERRLTSPIGC